MNSANISKILGYIVLACGIVIIAISWIENKADFRTLIESIGMVAFGLFFIFRDRIIKPKQ